ncbi:MAG: hypothetical protein QM791_06455 [Ferruginibacter sp.]
MKFFTLILSLYLLSTAFLPCSDGAERAEDKGQHTSNNSKTGKHGHEEDNCSPLCVCCCCASAFVQLTASHCKTVKRPLPSKKYARYTIVYPAEFYASIWQPPQLS